MNIPDYASPNRNVKFSDLVGKTLTKVDGRKGDETITFYTGGDNAYCLWHQQDCCESVVVEDICGDWDEIIGEPIIKAEENSNKEWPAEVAKPEYMESSTWTYYRITTMKGQVVIRWCGRSNGYYSESVSFCKLDK
jgi:hypothetical protein